jgi:hypothetical protein
VDELATSLFEQVRRHRSQVADGEPC